MADRLDPVPLAVAVSRFRFPAAWSVTVPPLTMLFDRIVPGAAGGRVWVGALPSVWPPRGPATKFAAAPAAGVRVENVRATDPPVPATVVTVDWPAARARAPAVSTEATP